MTDFSLIHDAFNFLVRDFDYWFSMYQSFIINLENFIDSNIIFIEINWSTSQQSFITKITHYPHLDTKEVTDSYIEWRSSVIDLRERLDFKIDQMTDKINLINDYQINHSDNQTIREISNKSWDRYNTCISDFNSSITSHNIVLKYKHIGLR